MDTSNELSLLLGESDMLDAFDVVSTTGVLLSSVMLVVFDSKLIVYDVCTIPSLLRIISLVVQMVGGRRKYK